MLVAAYDNQAMDKRSTCFKLKPRTEILNYHDVCKWFSASVGNCGNYYSLAFISFSSHRIWVYRNTKCTHTFKNPLNSMQDCLDILLSFYFSFRMLKALRDINTAQLDIIIICCFIQKNLLKHLYLRGTHIVNKSLINHPFTKHPQLWLKSYSSYSCARRLYFNRDVIRFM